MPTVRVRSPCPAQTNSQQQNPRRVSPDTLLLATRRDSSSDLHKQTHAGIGSNQALVLGTHARHGSARKQTVCAWGCPCDPYGSGAQRPSALPSAAERWESDHERDSAPWRDDAGSSPALCSATGIAQVLRPGSCAGGSHTAEHLCPVGKHGARCAPRRWAGKAAEVGSCE